MLRIISATFAFFVTVGSAFAADHTIIQKDKKFFHKNAAGELKTIKNLEIKKGDNIVFINEDKIAHNVYGKGGSFKFEIPKQVTGQKDTIGFSETGKTKIRCAIHPRMKLNVKVTD